MSWSVQRDFSTQLTNVSAQSQTAENVLPALPDHTFTQTSIWLCYYLCWWIRGGTKMTTHSTRRNNGATVPLWKGCVSVSEEKAGGDGRGIISQLQRLWSVLSEKPLFIINWRVKTWRQTWRWPAGQSGLQPSMMIDCFPFSIFTFILGWAEAGLHVLDFLHVVAYL